MPKAVPVTFGKFLELEKELHSMGFVEIPAEETMAIIRAFGLRPPRERRRGEICYRLSLNGYTVKVATSCLRDAVAKCRSGELPNANDIIVSRPASTDAGWALIVDLQGRAQYFARPIFRTENFVQTFLRRTWITRRRISHRPLCPTCNNFMDICSTQHGGNYWGCWRRALHPDGKGVCLGWNCNLPAKALKIAQAWEKQFAKYLREERKKGNEPRRASTIRRGLRPVESLF